MSRRTTSCIYSAAVAVGALAAFPVVANASQPPRTGPLLPWSAFKQTHLSVNEAGIQPIIGFIPQVVMGLTDEQNADDFVEGFGVPSSNPGGSTLPVGGPPQYVVATIDSGSQAHILRYDTAQMYNFPAAGRDGSKIQPVQGVSGEEEFTITDGIGVYMTGFSNANVSGGALGVTSGSLKGQWNVPVLTANPEDLIPNVVGSPILSQYRVTIQNSQPRHLTVGSTTYRTPNVILGSFSSTLPTGYARLTLQTSDVGPPDAPYYLNFDLSGPDEPDTPAAWSSLMTSNQSGGEVNISRGGSSANNQTFVLDTGAQLSIISNDTALAVGIPDANLDNAEFTIDVLGVGGVQTVPGYYLDTLTVNSQGNTVTAHHVPVIVLDVADPRNPSDAVPGILGTSVFNDRELILNTNVGQTAQNYLGIGPEWMWKTNGSGSWSNANNWNVVLPNGIDTQANFYGAITSAATVTVDSPVTVGSIAFDNNNRYTIAGPGTVTLSVSVEQAQINVFSGSHTIAAPVALASDTAVSIVPQGSILTVSGDVNSTSGAHGITKSGPGTLLLTGHNTYTGATLVQGGAVELGNNARDPILTGPGGADVQGGRLVFDYAGGSNPSTTIKSLLTTSHASNFATGQIRSSTADAQHGLGWMDRAGTSQVIVAYTSYGDANLDGQVDVTDLGALATHWQTSSVWAGGDFNYDGIVDVTDLGALATNWQSGVASPAPAMAFRDALASVGLSAVSIPEPAMFTLVSLASVLVLSKRRRMLQRV